MFFPTLAWRVWVDFASRDHLARHQFDFAEDAGTTYCWWKIYFGLIWRISHYLQGLVHSQVQDFLPSTAYFIIIFDELSIMRYPSPLPQGDWWYQFFWEAFPARKLQKLFDVFSSKTHVRNTKNAILLSWTNCTTIANPDDSQGAFVC